jgi:hypothetical protein
MIRIYISDVLWLASILLDLSECLLGITGRDERPASLISQQVFVFASLIAQQQEAAKYVKRDLETSLSRSKRGLLTHLRGATGDPLFSKILCIVIFM